MAMDGKLYSWITMEPLSRSGQLAWLVTLGSRVRSPPETNIVKNKCLFRVFVKCVVCVHAARDIEKSSIEVWRPQRLKEPKKQFKMLKKHVFVITTRNYFRYEKFPHFPWKNNRYIKKLSVFYNYFRPAKNNFITLLFIMIMSFCNLRNKSERWKWSESNINLLKVVLMFFFIKMDFGNIGSLRESITTNK